MKRKKKVGLQRRSTKTRIETIRNPLRGFRYLPRFLDKSILDTKKKLRVFEEKNDMLSADFLEKFDKGLVGDDQATMLWAAEYEALKLLERERSSIERMLSQCK